MNLHIRSTLGLCTTALICALMAAPSAVAQVAGQNVNMVSGTTWPYGDPFLERQNESTIAVSTRNPLHLLAGANDYRTVDLNLQESEGGEPRLLNAATGEPWLGQYISIDGGAHWQSTLLPGYPQDRSMQGLTSPLHCTNWPTSCPGGFATGADPVIASGTNGMFYYAGIAFNRGTSQGVVFVARYMDLNNQENGDIAQDTFPIRYINTVALPQGNVVPGQFLDKPWVAVDIPRGATTCSINVPQAGAFVQQTIPAGNVYVAYAKVISSGGNVTSTIYFTRSTNCGVSWSTPQAISQGYNISQGATIQIDPETGIVYVAWRVIHSGTQQPNDGIAIAASLDGGNRFFNPLTLVSLPPFNPANPTAKAFFDQGTTGTSFRTTAYPALAVADSGIAFVPGPLYLAWSQRGMGPNGEARIMMLAIPGNGSFTSSGFKPPTPFLVDGGAITNDVGGMFTSLTSGFQIMPTMTFNQGKLMVLYYDLRQDHTIGEYAPNLSTDLLNNDVFTPDANGNFFKETRDQVLDSPTCNVPLYFISDACLTVRRRTIDVVLAQSNVALVPTFTYSRVSHYDFGLFEGETANTPFHQIKFDPPNLPMFMQGLAAFLGDYLGIAGQPFALVKCGNSQCWTYNNPSPPGIAGTFLAAPKPAPSSPVHYATWTSNQDVIPPKDGKWDQYTAISTSGTSVYDGSTGLSCTAGYEGDRNQNVYSSRITQGLSITSPQTSKPLSSTVQRGFVILLQNQSSGRSTSSGFVNYFRLSIANQPVNGFASFAQLVPPSPVPKPPFPATNGNGIRFPLGSIDMAIAPHTGVARTVFAVSSNATASILVNVNEINALGGTPIAGGLSGFILLNADGTVPANLVDPNGNLPSDPNSISNVELYDPNVSAPNVSAPNVSAPNVSAPNVSAPNVSAPNVSAPNVSAPNVSAPNVSAYGVANPNVSAPNVSAPNVSAAPPSDGTFTVTNNRNTSASYNLALTGQTSTPLQLLLSQIYMTPQTDGNCNLIAQQQDITLANVPNAPITPVDQLSNPNVSAAPVTSPSFSLGPGDTAYITLRGNVDIPMMRQILTQVTPVIVPQAINSNNTTATRPPIIAPLFIVTASLPNVITGQSYNQTLSAIGGTLGSGDCSAYFWNWSGASNSGIPLGLTLSTQGVISGTPAVPGTYNVLVQVSDCPEHIATRVLSIRVLAPLAITTTSLPAAVVGGDYSANLVASGGTGAYTWSGGTGLPTGLHLNPDGSITGVAAGPVGVFPFSATVSDPGPPAQGTNATNLSISVVPATPAPPTSLTAISSPPSSVILSWSPSTSSVAGYNVYRAAVSGGPYTKLPSVGPTTLAFTDSTGAGGQTYYYVVTAFNSNNVESGRSNEVSAAIAIVPLFVGLAGDAVGDAGGSANPDLVFASVTTFNDNTVKLGVQFAPGTFNPQTSQAEFLLDTDQNTATGSPGVDSVGNDSAVMGSDYLVVLDSGFNNNQARIYKATGGLNQFAVLGTATVAVSTNGMDVTFPLSMLVNTVSSNTSGPATSGPWNFKVTDDSNIGTNAFTGALDYMPNLGLAPGTTAAPSTCGIFPTGFVPFTTVFSVAQDSAGDTFVVGRPAQGGIAELPFIAVPSSNQQFCNPVMLETNYIVPAYVPTVAERGGDFSGYAGLTLLDPLNSNQPFPNNMIPANRLDSIFVWRIPPHSVTLPKYACSLEPALHSIEGTITTSIQFTNNTAGPVNVFWIDYQGNRIFYRGGNFPTLAAGDSYVQGTFITHPWIVTDVATGACLGIWLPTESPGTAVITGSVAISSVNLSSTTLKIGGPNVPYTAILSNGIGTTVSSVLVQAYIDQGTASLAAGGSVVTCVPTLGDLPPGSCIFNFTVLASNSAAGTGTLVPGSATARFELRSSSTLFSVFTAAVTLQ